MRRASERGRNHPGLFFHREFRVFLSSARERMESLWEEFFRDPSQFNDVRNIKRSHKSPDFRHKITGKALWIDGSSNPAWVHAKLQRIGFDNVGVNVNDDLDAILQLIRSCGKKKDISMIRKISAEKDWIKQDICMSTTLIRSYAKCGAVKEAREVFDQLADPDVVSWTALIAGYAENGFGEKALKCFREMQKNKVTPNSVTYICALKACAVEQTIETVEEIHSHLREQRLLNGDGVLGNALVNAYSKCGAVKKAKEVFDQLADPDVVSWTALIAGYADHGFAEEAVKCFREMQRNRVAPNSVTYICVLKACGSERTLEVVEGIHAYVRDHGLLNKDIVLGNMLIDAYAKCGAMRKAREVFEELPKPNVWSWTNLIDGYADQGFGEEALICFKEMQRNKTKPDPVLHICTLKACAILGVLDIVDEIYAQVRDQALLNKDIVLGSTLINAYAKCGAVNKAREVFEQLAEPNVVSWNVLIAGYAKIGSVNKMLELLNRMMLSNIFPDLVTYIALLNGCSHGALLDEGQRLFGMIGMQGLAWTPEHYTCMVDLFGRVGQLNKAKRFVLDEATTLLAFLGACRKWINVDHARWAFEKLFQVDRKCSSAYVCMSNIYAAAGMMKEADEFGLERLGYVVQDKNHLQSKIVYSALGTLCDRLTKEGYSQAWLRVSGHVPFHQKDNMFCSHSEKLAVAYVLINTTMRKWY